MCAGSVQHLWILLSAVAGCFDKTLQSPPVTLPPQRFAHGRTECHFHFGTRSTLIGRTQPPDESVMTYTKSSLVGALPMR